MNALMNIVLNVLSTFLSLTGWLRLMIAAAILLVAASGLWFMQHEAEDHPEHTYWTCPMHPQIKEDRPGQCPICHMDLVAVKPSSPAETNATHRHEESGADPGPAGQVHISQQSQQLIGLKTAVVEEKELHTTIETTGRVAFDPELAVAIREYLTIAMNDPGLRQYAITRLKMLGMGDEEIRTLPARRRDYESLYL